MDVQVSERALGALEGDLVALFAFAPPEGPSAEEATIDAALGNVLTELRQAGDWAGKAEETALVYTRGALGVRRVLLVSLGAREAFGRDPLRRAAAASAKAARSSGIP